MSARVLLVDDVAARARLLEAQLTAEYFEVLTAHDGPTALEICAAGQCDIVLLDVIMPGMDGLEVCRRLKRNPLTAHLPVVIMTRLDSQSERVAGLEAGADDFLMEPISMPALTTRLKSLMRLKTVTDTLMARALTSQGMGLGPSLDMELESDLGGRVLLVDDAQETSAQVVAALEDDHAIACEADPQAALFRVAEGNFDITIVSLNLKDTDGLRLCSQLRSLDRTHLLPIIVLIDMDDEPRLMRALDIGVNDYLPLPLDHDELRARVRTQLRRKRFGDRLRDSVETTLEMAVTDSLTGLHNRRYLDRRLSAMIEDATAAGNDLSLMILDIDYFKSINDSYGHLSGDAVLREFARRMRASVRGMDVAARMGGEEFVIAMPGADMELAGLIGERLRQTTCEQPFDLPVGTNRVNVTVSIGVSSWMPPDDTAERLIMRADAALYRAKREGRNRVVSAAA